MKIALILLSCLVGLSYQQRFFWSLPAPISPYVPRFVANNNYPFEAPIIADPEDEPVGRLAQQPRFFLGFNPFFNPFGMGQGIVTWTYTSWMTATATATSAVLQYCIPAASFSTVNLFNQGQQGFPLGNPQIATDYCNRRKRAAILDELELVESINPSQIEQVVPSALVEPAMEKREAQYQPQLVSSKEEESSYEAPRMPRQLGLTRTYRLTVTSTATSYTFSSTVYRQTIRLGSSLQCLPIGFAVC